jgi:hypothetical protein
MSSSYKKRTINKQSPCPSPKERSHSKSSCESAQPESGALPTDNTKMAILPLVADPEFNEDSIQPVLPQARRRAAAFNNKVTLSSNCSPKELSEQPQHSLSMVPRLRAFNQCEVHTGSQMRNPWTQLRISKKSSTISAKRTIDRQDLSPQLPERSTNVLSVKAIDENVRLALNSSVGSPTREHEKFPLRTKNQLYQTMVT